MEGVCSLDREKDIDEESEAVIQKSRQYLLPAHCKESITEHVTNEQAPLPT